MRTPASIFFFLGLTAASPLELLAERQSSCPDIHLFGARETTAPAGYGSSSAVVDLVLDAYPGSTSEAIVYPACGGQSSCGGVSYASSVQQGVSAVTTAVNSYNAKCPNTKLVLVGYSQGGQIFDDALCGGGDPEESISSIAVPLTAAAVTAVKAAIFMGDPRHTPGLSYNVGTCQANGFDPRSSGFQCPSAAKIQSYCDATDPYCCNGDDAATHDGYGTEYGQDALTFIKKELGASSDTSTSTPASSAPVAGSTPTTPASTGGTIPKYGQCGGTGWTGLGSCAAGSTCTAYNPYFSQCV